MRILLLLAISIFLVIACGGSSDVVASATTSAAPVATTAVPATTTASVTTTVAPTTTTMDPLGDQGDDADRDHLRV